MKKSTTLIIVVIWTIIGYYLSNSEIHKIILSIQGAIFSTGYFVVKQLEENNSKNRKNDK